MRPHMLTSRLAHCHGESVLFKVGLDVPCVFVCVWAACQPLSWHSVSEGLCWRVWVGLGFLEMQRARKHHQSYGLADCISLLNTRVIDCVCTRGGLQIEHAIWLSTINSLGLRYHYTFFKNQCLENLVSDNLTVIFWKGQHMAGERKNDRQSVNESNHQWWSHGQCLCLLQTHVLLSRQWGLHLFSWSSMCF